MKLAKAIATVNQEKPNSFTQELLTEYINQLEASIQDFLGISRDEWKRYEWKDDGDAELLAPTPYDVLYLSYLRSKIDYALEEYESYANNQVQFESDFEDWKAWAMRSGMVISDAPQSFFNWF